MEREMETWKITPAKIRDHHDSFASEYIYIKHHVPASYIKLKTYFSKHSKLNVRR